MEGLAENDARERQAALTLGAANTVPNGVGNDDSCFWASGLQGRREWFSIHRRQRRQSASPEGTQFRNSL